MGRLLAKRAARMHITTTQLYSGAKVLRRWKNIKGSTIHINNGLNSPSSILDNLLTIPTNLSSITEIHFQKSGHHAIQNHPHFGFFRHLSSPRSITNSKLSLISQSHSNRAQSGGAAAVEAYLQGLEASASAELASLQPEVPASVWEAISNPTAGPALGGASGIATADWYSSLDQPGQSFINSVVDAESSLFAETVTETAFSVSETGTAASGSAEPTGAAETTGEASASAPGPAVTSVGSQSTLSTSTSAKSSSSSSSKTKNWASKPTGGVAGAIIGLGGALAGAALMV
jgi:hypothetical protein